MARIFIDLCNDGSVIVTDETQDMIKAWKAKTGCLLAISVVRESLTPNTTAQICPKCGQVEYPNRLHKECRKP